MPKSQSPESYIRDAFARSGRTDARLLKRCLAESKGSRNGMASRDVATWALRMQGLRLADGDGPIEILPSRRDPAVAERIESIAEEEVRIEDRLATLRRDRAGLSRTAVAECLKREGRTVPEDLVVSEGHACDGSPVGSCAYDADGDPNLDECLFCGLPDERK